MAKQTQIDDIEVYNERITKLLYGAQGFRKTFYLVFDSAIKRVGCEDWQQNGDFMSVMATNGCFSIELYLKFLMVLSTFDNTTFKGYHCKGHKLEKLHDYLSQKNQSLVNELNKEYSSSKFAIGSFRDFLKNISKYFEQWRYAYDNGSLSMNLNLLSDILNILNECSEKVFNPISKILATGAPQPQNDNQILFYSNEDDITM